LVDGNNEASGGRAVREALAITDASVFLSPKVHVPHQGLLLDLSVRECRQRLIWDAQRQIIVAVLLGRLDRIDIDRILALVWRNVNQLVTAIKYRETDVENLLKPGGPAVLPLAGFGPSRDYHRHQNSPANACWHDSIRCEHLRQSRPNCAKLM